MQLGASEWHDKQYETGISCAWLIGLSHQPALVPRVLRLAWAGRGGREQ